MVRRSNVIRRPTPGVGGKVGAWKRRRPSSNGRGFEDGAPTVSAERKSRRVWQRMWFPHASQMVRGLCPRDWIRWAVDVGKYTVCIVVKIGHA